jgi:hypothetical protein
MNALEVMPNNCGTALYFRTSDIRTQSCVRDADTGSAGEKPATRDTGAPACESAGWIVLRDAMQREVGLFHAHLPN